MALYIAILDDNPAERKQFERLLSREASARTSSGEVIYIDSYGNEESLSSIVLKYDLIFIDISDSKRDGTMIAADFRNKGFTAPIVLCSDMIKYEMEYGKNPTFIVKQKPLWQRDFAEYIDLASKEKADKPLRIELRNEVDAIYLTQDEILYARQHDGYMNITLTEGRKFQYLGDLFSLENLLMSFDPIFLEISKSTVLNMQYVVSHSINAFKMSDGAVLHYNIIQKPVITRYWKQYLDFKLAKKNEEN